MGVKISQLLPVITPELTDIFPIVQAGVTYKESFTQLTGLFATAGANSNITSLTGLTGVIEAPTAIASSTGQDILQFLYETNAVNFFSISNSISGMGPTFQVAGLSADANINMNLTSKGTGQIVLFGANGAGGISPVVFINGTNDRHSTTFSFADTAELRTVTFPDLNGTVYLSSKANGTEATNTVTANGTAGVITTSSLTTAGGANYAITWTNSFINSSSVILLSIMGGTNTTQNITLNATAGSGTSTLTIYNISAATALNGTIFISYMII
jgi:hypothetical protein